MSNKELLEKFCYGFENYVGWREGTNKCADAQFNKIPCRNMDFILADTEMTYQTLRDNISVFLGGDLVTASENCEMWYEVFQ